jgi:hypothetical protein
MRDLYGRNDALNILIFHDINIVAYWLDIFSSFTM